MKDDDPVEYTAAYSIVPAKKLSWRERVWADLTHFFELRVVQLTLLFLFGIGTLIITLYNQRIPSFELQPSDPLALSLDDSAANDTVNGVASKDVIVTHDFQRVDTRNTDTELQRQKLLKQVPQIWVRDFFVSNNIDRKIRLSFTRMRSTLCSDAFPLAPQDEEIDTQKEQSDEQKEQADIAAKERKQQADRFASCNQMGLPKDILSDKERIQSICGEATRESIAQILGIEVFDKTTCQEIAVAGASDAIRNTLKTHVDNFMWYQIVSTDEQLERAQKAVESPGGLVLQNGIEARDHEPMREAVNSIQEFKTIDTVRKEASALANKKSADGEKSTIPLLVAKLLEPNTFMDEAATRRAQEQATDSITNDYEPKRFYRGQKLLQKGEIITPEIGETIKQMQVGEPRIVKLGWEIFGLALLLIISATVVWLNTRDKQRGWTTRDISMMGLMLLIQTAIVRAGFEMSQIMLVSRETPAVSIAILAAIPFAIGPLVVKTLTGLRNALVFTVLAGILVAAMSNYELPWFLVSIASGAVAISLLGAGDQRNAFLKSAVAAGATTGLLLLALYARGTFNIDLKEAANLLWGVGISIIATSLFALGFPFLFEVAFRYTTPSKLRELENEKHPLRKQLRQKALGTYDHSENVADLTEHACEMIGANDLLGRVGAKFHDIGKLWEPAFFTENRVVPNPHDQLTPEESAKRILAHVPKGVEYAKRAGLPPEIIDFIQMHHGTMTCGFYNAACKQFGAENVDESLYKYAGPIPQTKETGICLLADGIEAHLRSEAEKSESKIKHIVDQHISKAIRDEQLIESGLTFGDIKVIEQAFIQKLSSMYHSRPKYAPDPKLAGDTQATIEAQPPAGAEPTPPQPWREEST